MPTDLEDAIRDALRSRADAVVQVHADLRGRAPRRWMPVLLAAAAVVVLAAVLSVVLTRGPGSKTQAGSARFVGHRWNLVAVDDRYGHLAVPSTITADVTFNKDGTLQAHDGANVYTGRVHVSGNSFTVSDVTGSAGGSTASPSSAPARVNGAIDAVLQQRVTASVIGATLTLQADGEKLTLVRNAAATAAFVGYRWNLVAVDDSSGHLVVPSSLHPNIGFARDGSFLADDTVNSESGTYVVSGAGYSTRDVASTLVGSSRPDPVRARVIAAIDAAAQGPATASVSGDTLTLRVAGSTLTLRRAGVEPNPSPASATTTHR